MIIHTTVWQEWKQEKDTNFLFIHSFVCLFFSFICLHKILVSRETKISNQNVYFLFSPFFLFLSLFRPFFLQWQKITIKILILIFCCISLYFPIIFLVRSQSIVSSDNKKNWKMSRSIYSLITRFCVCFSFIFIYIFSFLLLFCCCFFRLLYVILLLSFSFSFSFLFFFLLCKMLIKKCHIQIVSIIKRTSTISE